MSKELEEYKYSNLELLREIWFNVPEGSQKTHQKHFDLILSKLNELQAIKEANPSEALKMLEGIGTIDLGSNPYTTFESDMLKNVYKPEFNIIKQALMKQLSGSQYHNIIIDEAQEPKQYIKWEDFIFKHTPKTIDVKMGENKYTLVVGFNVTGCELVILRNKKQQYFFLEADKQFFNDLRLERVEE